jgi:hypothetical protein
MKTKTIIGILVVFSLSLAMVCQIHAASAQDTGVITACATKEQVRIVDNTRECKSHEISVFLVSLDGLSAIYQGMCLMFQQGWQEMEDKLQEQKVAGEQKLAAAMAAVDAKQQEIEKQLESAQAIFAAALAVSAGGIASPAEVMDVFSDSTVRSQILQLENLVTCSQDLDGDGIPNDFAQCVTCGQSLPPACGGMCLNGGSCVPVVSGDVVACACMSIIE